MPTTVDLAAWRAALAKMTPGEWKHDNEDIYAPGVVDEVCVASCNTLSNASGLAYFRNHATAMADRVEELEKFKSWTHQYLDTHGVPNHPPGPHGAEGCRIGDRMDWLIEKQRELEEELATVTEDRQVLTLHLVQTKKITEQQYQRMRELEEENKRLRASLNMQADIGI